MKYNTQSHYQSTNISPEERAAEVLHSSFKAPTRSVYEQYREGIVTERNWLGGAKERDYGQTEGKTYEEWVELLQNQWNARVSSTLNELGDYLPQYGEFYQGMESFRGADLKTGLLDLQEQLAVEMQSIDALKSKQGFASSGNISNIQSDAYTTIQNTSDNAFQNLKKGNAALRSSHVADVYNMTKNLILTGAFGDDESGMYGYDEDPQDVGYWAETLLQQVPGGEDFDIDDIYEFGDENTQIDFGEY